jgi:hypothetical protein
MKIKVGQYARLNNGVIGEYIGMCDGECEHIMLKTKETYHYETQIINVANTPQELIEVGDLVELSGEDVVIVQDIMINTIYTFVSGNVSINHITKILTPNTNGGYDLQWEMK